MPISLLKFMAPACLVIALASVSCQVTGSFEPQKRALSLYEWNDDGGPGKVTVRISLTDQIAEFERGGRLIGWCCVATGKPGHGTSPGHYRIMEKVVDKYSTFYGVIEDDMGNVVDGDATPRTPVPKGMVYMPSPMPYWLRLTSGGIGMHGGVIPEPGRPASHGCIRMPKEFAPVLYEVVDIGTSVIISTGKSRRGSLLDGTPPIPAPEWAGGSRVISTRPL